MTKRRLKYLEEKYQDKFDLVKSACLIGILLDQNDSSSDIFFGSWGKTINDYCYNNTRDYTWIWCKSSA
ncbi:hypothetical protein SLH46_21250 [Draconibacterium sp. IB214405]|uniref:hypothetical protein n=1 Tax=Draconibacterium sp. IB214405 TaxID=3097352 RepID=UPI002A16D7B7|nr:hypothetical protein [Draconibacterium sp. IB214405]MDX8341740.1 hypothetical protein [Draconibacterium sp. IB214405]